ncbi:MAG: hypothetical protein A2Y03_03685 [Omnitrophica WOR_2 bacterium GWF2_38_59]|nr:MAG: hypothetical protein A2Y06_05650 [Omnitrophica WOR_2 bacterium GWA2_37_7]OGX22827.1 MAG: hypothetical protein A2Y03_03685 [Omnitrophica WOR_2 bacterium GWF2_38_59]OGX50792.1 MAG: hypothetical protein A2243_07445 [Omnitrophica WOR_2 bacterium RIFOXYA2_FULL_38_17]OGX55441.1 MAG: hypothetical protein A2447_01760 [Omnitrophica WOR_2 bacterium RIFOXYC2_FULL_38_12]OGX60036.1 MAG: hypothetical protein A2306_02840 [Omnitrophica WOR_2 bacterium RIFOXYB2_FULL_38_16]HBG60786.1 hypothetical protei
MKIKTYSLILFLMLMVSPAFAQVQIFMGKGSAVVINDDKAAATKIAYEAAKRKALTEAMSSLLHKGQKDEVNFNNKKSQLLKGPYTYIQKENQISNYMKGKMLNIEISFAVDMEELKKLLGKEGVLVTENKEKNKAQFPGVMVIISEEISGKINTVPYTTAVITDYLIKNEFKVLDEKIVQKNISQEQAVQAVNGNMAAANAVALQYGSGIVITGKTAVQQSSLKSGGGMQAYGANITMRAIKADTGDVLASASADGSFPHINAMTGSRKAAEQAAMNAIEKIVKDIEKSLESSSNGIVITISPINYKQLAIVKQLLTRDFKDISAIKQNSFNNKVAKLDIQYEGGIADFADEIALKDFGTFNLVVIQFSPGKVDFELKMK